jgi:hypothetical protein
MESEIHSVATMKERRHHNRSDEPKAQPVAKAYQRTQIEADFVADHFKRAQQRLATPKLKVVRKSEKSVQIEPDHADHTLWIALVHAGMGSLNWPFACKLLDELVNASCQSSATKPLKVNEANGVLAAMHGIAPKDEVEAMLAAQMVATHSAAMTMLRRLKDCETSDSGNSQQTNRARPRSSMRLSPSWSALPSSPP